MGNNLNNIYLVADNIISSLGFTTQENMDAIIAKRSGITLTNNKYIAETPILAATICSDKLSALSKKQGLEKYTKLEQLIILSINDLLTQYDINLSSSKCGVIISTTKGNIDLLKNRTDDLNTKVYLGNTATEIENYFALTSKIQIISNACISGISALIVAKELLQSGKYSHMIVVGVDVLSNFITSGFQSFKSLSENICKPYDTSRDGLNLGEACGSILLTTDETANAFVLRGGAISNDANHISGPSRTGDGLFYAIRNAMSDANATADEINFLNLHGTATVYNDEMEGKAVHLAQLQNIPANSLKPYFGHTLGASGIIETIACIHQLKISTIFGTLNYKESGLTLPLRINADHIKISNATSCIKTASGFGGCNAAIVLSKEAVNKEAKEVREIKEVKKCITENSKVILNNEIVFESNTEDFPTFIREAFKSLSENNQKFYKMDDQCKLGYIASTYLLQDIQFKPTEMAIILSNHSSSLDTDLKYQKIIDKDGDHSASPAIFVYTLPSIVAGEICIRHKIQGENTFFVSNTYQEEELKNYAERVLQKEEYRYCIYGWIELFDNSYKAELNLIEKE